MKFNRKSLTQDLMKRAQESFETRDEGGKYGKYLRSMPAPYWKCAEGEHLIDVIPFFTGEHYPTRSHIGQGPVSPDKPVYWLDIWVHSGIGMDENSYVCPNRSYGEPCPICEDVARMQKQMPPDEETIDKIKAKHRSVYLIVCRDTIMEEKKGLQVFEVAFYYMEKNLSALAKKPMGGGYVPFADPTSGKSVYFTKTGTRMSQEWAGHQFVERTEIISDEILEKSFSIADYVIRLSYEELYRAYYGVGINENTAQRDEGSAKKQPASSTASRMAAARAASKAAESPSALPPDEYEPYEPTDEPPTEEETNTKSEEAPPPPPIERKRRAPASPAVEEPPQDQPTPRLRRPTPAPEPLPTPEPTPTTKCPGGGVFGVDTDKLAACGPCTVWDDCAAEAQRLDEEKRKRR